MGIDISGGMIVGRDLDEVVFEDYDEDEWDGDEWGYRDSLDLSTYSRWFDAGSEGQVVGFEVCDVMVDSEDFNKWVEEVKEKAREFEKLTGTKAKLIGMQDIW